METVLSILGSLLALILGFSALFAIYGLPFGVIAMLIASGTDKWESEDQAQYQQFNPRVKLVRERLTREVPRKSGCVLGEEVFIVMEEKVFFCFEYQSQDDARRIMREHQVPYLIVLDKQLRVAGTVWMEDLMPPGDQQKST